MGTIRSLEYHARAKGARGKRPVSGDARLAGHRTTRLTRAAALPDSSGQKKQLRLDSNGLWRKSLPDFRWANAISKEEWETYRSAIAVIQSCGIPFLLGGGFALATFTGRWRDTKDIDFYIHPSDRNRVVTALTKAGFSDYYSQLAYDRKWIYRSVKSGVIVDIIWAMANQRAQVDNKWFDHASLAEVRGERLHVLPLEELMWCKLYIMQRDHCDWIDIFNLTYAKGQQVDWDRLIKRLGEDTPLLCAMLQVFCWLCPRRGSQLPESLWRRLKMANPVKMQPRSKRDHIRLLDSRAWFAALLPFDRKLEV